MVLRTCSTYYLVCTVEYDHNNWYAVHAHLYSLLGTKSAHTNKPKNRARDLAGSECDLTPASPQFLTDRFRSGCADPRAKQAKQATTLTLRHTYSLHAPPPDRPLRTCRLRTGTAAAAPRHAPPPLVGAQRCSQSKLASGLAGSRPRELADSGQKPTKHSQDSSTRRAARTQQGTQLRSPKPGPGHDSSLELLATWIGVPFSFLPHQTDSQAFRSASAPANVRPPSKPSRFVP